MPLRYDAIGKWSENPDVVDPLCIVPKDVNRAQLKETLECVFAPNMAARFSTPEAFNFLLEWVPGDLRWPVAAFLLRTGLNDGVTYSARDVATRLSRGMKTIENITRPTGHQSYRIMLRDAVAFSGGIPMANELRRAGLFSVAWTSLARAEVRTVAAFRAIRPDDVRKIDGIGPKVFEHIYQVLG